MTDENLSPVVTARPRRRVFVALLAVVTIVITARAIWLQLPSVLPARGETAGSNTRSSRRASSFDMSNATIPVERIMRGGPPKDGIPALSDAKFVSAEDVSFMAPNDRVIGVTIAGEAKAYPLKILDRHEAVNDRLASRSIAVTYCPLCDSSAVFERQYGDEVIEFGISGLLFNSNVLLYNRENAGMFVVELADSGIIRRKDLAELLLCPNTQLADDVFHGKVLMKVLTREELGRLTPEAHKVLQMHMSGSFAYQFGYVDDNGKYRRMEFVARGDVPMLADAPSFFVDGFQSANHGGCGQNVIYQDLSCRYSNQCISASHDHLFLNANGQHAAGRNAHDAVLGRSEASPAGLLLPVRQ